VTQEQQEQTVEPSPSRQAWDQMSRALQDPFDPAEVDFRVQGRANDQAGRAQVVAYIDARAVQDRLDTVVGAGNWSFDWTPLVIDNGEVMVAKGTLTIHGISKSDVGSASNFEQSLGAVSHCFKRAAVHWGIGRYLYNLPMTWVQVERGGRIPEAVLRDLRAKLPRVAGQFQEGEEGSPERRLPTIVREQTGGVSAASEEPARAQARPATGQGDQAAGETMATEKQIASIRKLCEALGKSEPETETLTYNRARELLTQLSGEYQRARKAS
jgi:hypothetical protein